MTGYLEQTVDRRRLICSEAQEKLNLPAASLEKDFWVCWILREMFSIPDWGDKFTFKGGTSLSKCYGLIHRFSEDIDIVIDRGFLRFAGADSPEDSTSNKQRRKRLEALKDAAQRWIHRDLTSFLTERIGTALSGMDKWDLCSASLDEDPDGQTLLFTYPSAVSQTGGYIRRQVKIEMGARSDNEPVEEREVHPHLFDALPTVIGPSMFRVRVLAAERTFWEKAMLVHEETLRPPGRRRPARLARHYYDLWCLITAGIGERAAEREDIFARTVRHREVYFNWSWMDYSTLKRGGLRLVPLPEMVAEWRKDYQAMSGEMFFGDVPEFDLVIKVIESFQRRFNEK
jgi:predicted nucleotidyltransferase component of viral defense system